MTRAQAAATADPEGGSALVSAQRRNFVFLAIVLGMLVVAVAVSLLVEKRSTWADGK